MEGFLAIFIFVVVSIYLGYYFHLKIKLKQMDLEVEKTNKEISTWLEVNNIPKDALRVTYFGGLNAIDEHPKFKIASPRGFHNFYTWIEGNKIRLFSMNSKNSLGGHEISANDIISFSKYGDIYSEQIISGGGGGGSSIGGAIVGGLVAGPAGAVIGSRKEINPISSYNLIHDNRQTIVQMKQEGELKYIIFDSQIYEILLKLFPNKEINFIHKNNNSDENNIIVDKIKKLAELKDMKIISEDDFNQKKKDLLERLL